MFRWDIVRIDPVYSLIIGHYFSRVRIKQIRLCLLTGNKLPYWKTYGYLKYIFPLSKITSSFCELSCYFALGVMLIGLYCMQKWNSIYICCFTVNILLLEVYVFCSNDDCYCPGYSVLDIQYIYGSVYWHGHILIWVFLSYSTIHIWINGMTLILIHYIRI